MHWKFLLSVHDLGCTFNFSTKTALLTVGKVIGIGEQKGVFYLPIAMEP